MSGLLDDEVPVHLRIEPPIGLRLPPWSKRQRRLLGCAYVRRIWSLLPDESSRQIVQAAELIDDCPAKAKDLENAIALVTSTWSGFGGLSSYTDDLTSTRNNASWAAIFAARASDSDAAAAAIRAVEWHARAGCHHPSRSTWRDETWVIAKHAGATEQDAQRDLRGHMRGNQFHPYPAPASWPAAVVQLAEAVYQGTDAGFALHDALLEAGHPVLAEHFHQEQTHPKGCWVVDLILGKN